MRALLEQGADPAAGICDSGTALHAIQTCIFPTDMAEQLLQPFFEVRLNLQGGWISVLERC